MTDQQLLDRNAVVNRIREIVADALDTDPEAVTPDANLFEEYGLDSIGAVMVYVDLSMEYGIPEPSPDEDLKQIDTVFKFTDYVLERAQ